VRGQGGAAHTTSGLRGDCRDHAEAGGGKVAIDREGSIDACLSHEGEAGSIDERRPGAGGRDELREGGLVRLVVPGTSIAGSSSLLGGRRRGRHDAGDQRIDSTMTYRCVISAPGPNWS
jgi:hypothetical protein